VRYLSKRKSNYSARDFVRMTMRNGILVPDAPLSHVDGIVAANAERLAENACIAGYRSLMGMGVAPSDAKNSPDFLPTHLTAKRLNAGHSKQDLARAMHRLMAAGIFSRGPVGRYTNGNVRQGLVMRDTA
jgi:hypothetical protein